MGAVRKLEVELGEERLDAIKAAVAVGDYSDASDVIDQALRLWEESRVDDTARLRRLVEEGLASGEPEELTPALMESIKAQGRNLARRRTAG